MNQEAGTNIGSFNKSMEFMMMKRLNFLRNSLDSHNPHDTTIRMRDNASKRRDERILELWRKDQMMPSVETLISKLHQQNAKKVRNDWSDDNNGNDAESLMENDMRSIVSTEEKVGGQPSPQQLQQNSLFSSIHGQGNNTSISISGGNSIQVPADSRLKSGLDEEGTIGGSTAYPYPHESINSAAGQQEQSRGFRSTKESPMNMRATHPMRGSKNRAPNSRILDNINKKKFTTNIDDEADKIRLRNEELGKKKNMTSVEPFWQDFNSTITDICQEKEHPQGKMQRQRGPSQPAMRNKSSKKMQMHQTHTSFKMGQGSVESDHTHVAASAGSKRDKHVKLQPLNTKRTPKIDINTQVAMEQVPAGDEPQVDLNLQSEEMQVEDIVGDKETAAEQVMEESPATHEQNAEAAPE